MSYPHPGGNPYADVPRGTSQLDPAMDRYGCVQLVPVVELRRAIDPAQMLAQVQLAVLRKVQQATHGRTASYAVRIFWHAVAGWACQDDEPYRERWAPGEEIPPWADSVEIRVLAEPC